MAMINDTVSLYLVFKNCGMVYILFLRYTGINQTAMMMSASAAIHS